MVLHLNEVREGGEVVKVARELSQSHHYPDRTLILTATFILTATLILIVCMCRGRMLQRKVDVRLPGRGNSNSNGARPVY